jgi:glycosyltransferase involved in cell wall biosynthesis
MTILYFLPALEFGGAERFLIDLLKGHSREVKPILLTFSHLQPHLEGLPCQVLWLDDLGIEPSQISAIFFKQHARSTWHVVRELAGVIKREKPELVVGVLHIAALLLAVARDLFGVKAPFVANLHGHATGYLQGEVKPALLRALNGLLLRYLCARAEAIIVPGRGIADDLVECFQVASAKIRWVPSGLALESIRQRMCEPVKAPWETMAVPLVLGVGRLTPEKAFGLLIEAVAILRTRIPARLIILGEGVERARLERRCKELGLSDDVILPGFEPNPFRYMHLAQTLVLSSIHEGLGMVLLEAMACGCPVVATDCPSGPQEIIQDGENGLLVPVNDPPAIADALLRVLTDAMLRQRLIQGGFHRVSAFTISRMVEGYEGVYNEILATRCRVRR